MLAGPICGYALTMIMRELVQPEELRPLPVEGEAEYLAEGLMPGLQRLAMAMPRGRYRCVPLELPAGIEDAALITLHPWIGRVVIDEWPVPIEGRTRDVWTEHKWHYDVDADAPVRGPVGMLLRFDVRLEEDLSDNQRMDRHIGLVGLSKRAERERQLE